MALANTGTGLPHVVIDEVLSELLPTYCERRAKAVKQAKPGAREPSLPSAQLAGRWTGTIRTYRGNVPLTFSFKPSGDVHAKLGTQLTTLLDNARYEKQRLTGKMAGDLAILDDMSSAPYYLEFELFLRDGVLNGAVTTSSHASRFRAQRWRFG